MKKEIPNAVRPIRLVDFLPEFGDEVIWVWVNPTRDVLERRFAQVHQGAQLRKELNELKTLTDDLSRARVLEISQELTRVGEALMAWLAEIWSQHKDPETHFSPEDVKTLVDECLEREPELYGWLISETFRLISEHRKKKSMT